MNVRVAVIIPSYDNVRDTIAACEAVVSVGDSSVMVIAVDDGSPGDVPAKLAEGLCHLPGVCLKACEVNSGFAAACNAGVVTAQEKCSAEFYLFLNNDASLASGAIAALLQPFALPNVGLVGPKIYLGSGPRLNSVGGYFDNATLQKREEGCNVTDVGQFDSQRDVEFLMGSAFMIRASLYHELGGMDESYFMYSEEADICLRALRRGFRIVYNPAAVVFHHHGRTMGVHSNRALYYSVRNKIHFVCKRGRSRQVFATLFMLHATTWRELAGTFAKRLLVFQLGVLDGLRGRMGRRVSRLF